MGKRTRRLRAVVLVPTHDLAAQVENFFRKNTFPFKICYRRGACRRSAHAEQYDSRGSLEDGVRGVRGGRGGREGEREVGR